MGETTVSKSPAAKGKRGNGRAALEKRGKFPPPLVLPALPDDPADPGAGDPPREPFEAAGYKVKTLSWENHPIGAVFTQSCSGHAWRPWGGCAL
jgi:hypothetical protein